MEMEVCKRAMKLISGSLGTTRRERTVLLMWNAPVAVAADDSALAHAGAALPHAVEVAAEKVAEKTRFARAIGNAQVAA